MNSVCAGDSVMDPPGLGPEHREVKATLEIPEIPVLRDLHGFRKSKPRLSGTSQAPPSVMLPIWVPRTPEHK